MKKILIVEDDQFIRDIYEEVLKDEGYQITCASDGQKGYEEMKKKSYDLVLLDIMLPKLDGIDILQKLQKEGKLKQSKTIFLLTNLSGEAIMKKKGRIEVDEYLIKSSLTPDKLVEKIKAYLK
ncbi:MAG TPA: response regulator [Candidatus Bathyarchaeia archaeon]|nr:response regulator [Candidatus Bathyarchaeia archaeon]